MKFVDMATIRVRAGDGGSGCISFRREKYVPKGGPDGGNGGRGGSVILRANRHLATLLDFQYKRSYTAKAGDYGMGAKKTGKSGEDITVEVPEGTLVRRAGTNEILVDLVKHGDEFLVARGGRGGRGNSEFATATDQAPRRYEQGEPGEELEIELELKLLADVGLVGLPNAGKSTLISVISAARPKIADYPFTTLVPNLGIVRIDEGKSFVVADIPGLIEGAHDGKGLGLQFLRHVERTRVLVFLLDATRGTLKEDLAVLTRELRLHNAALVRKKSLIAVTKIDALDESSLRQHKRERFGRKNVHFISAVAGTGVRELVDAIWNELKPRERRSPGRTSLSKETPGGPAAQATKDHTARKSTRGSAWKSSRRSAPKPKRGQSPPLKSKNR
ncbi:MAG: Small GTP-binding protein domain [Bacteroidetes bacterium]|nr:Small GTP-binding protein domain [Bacteroidota bacterium]